MSMPLPSLDLPRFGRPVLTVAFSHCEMLYDIEVYQIKLQESVLIPNGSLREVSVLNPWASLGPCMDGARGARGI
jgi:hypothetical protein